jgi:hypothetical protein
MATRTLASSGKISVTDAWADTWNNSMSKAPKSVIRETGVDGYALGWFQLPSWLAAFVWSPPGQDGWQIGHRAGGLFRLG